MILSNIGRWSALLLASAGLTWPALCTAADLPAFKTLTLEEHVGDVCYAVAAADVDGDGRQDVVAVTENRVVWFQNPDWKLRVIIENQTERDNVCIAPHDIDGDGQIDFALGAGWTKVGTLHWLTRGKSLDDKWQVHALGREGWTHRMRWGDILGTGQPQLIVSPLNKTVAPQGVRLLALEVSAQPRIQAWKTHVLDESLNAMHNHWTGDFDGDGKTDILTASLEGIFLFQGNGTPAPRKMQLSGGTEGPREPQKSGAGEIRVGQLGPTKFIATSEPMHGHNVVVYTPPVAGEVFWTRHVLDGELKRAHAVGVADLNGDGLDEVVIGHSDLGTGALKGPGVFIYTATQADGSAWTKHVLDNGGIATEDLVIADFNGDGRPDIAAGGRATHNVKLYLNQAP